MSNRKENRIDRYWKDRNKEDFTTDQLFYQNEREANSLVAFAMLIMSVVVLVSSVLMITGVFEINFYAVWDIMLRVFLELTIPVALCYVTKADRPWLKYLMLIELIVVLARIDTILNYNVTLIMVIPVILSCRYFYKNFTLLIASVSAVMFAISAFCGTYFGMGYPDLNFVTFKNSIVIEAGGDLFDALRAAGIDNLAYARDFMNQSYLPRFLIFFVISVVCFRIAKKGRKMVRIQQSISENNTRIESELALATDIQANMLPSIFPAFPDRSEFDIYACMNPAKEVGGDFYDFFMLDEKRVAFLVGDVSGKGVPAALFMVIAKTLIKNNMQMGNTPEVVFTKVNQMLCEGNKAGLFVTAWMGVLDLIDGTLTYVNAGHNPPVIKRGDQGFEYLHSHHGFVLAGLEGIRYKERTLQMQPGDKIFLYTDGVTEATDKDNKLYGEERLLAFLNGHMEEKPTDMIRKAREDIDAFVQGVEQFDDITMLMVEYKEVQEEEIHIEKEFDADINRLHQVIAFVEEELEKIDCPPRAAMQITVAVEEIFVNIARYAYGEAQETMKLAVTPEEDGVALRFIDHGLPFDPLAKQDPDISLPIEERDIGGLGIMMVKKTMDDVQYKFENGQNILTLIKKWSKK